MNNFMANKKILIVEDDQALAHALQNKLTSESFITLSAGNGQEGLNMAEKEKPDLILLDVIMPIMDGLTMLQKMKKNPDLADIPIILLTNLNDAETVSRALAMGLNDYLVKTDWKLQDIVKLVREKIGG